MKIFSPQGLKRVAGFLLAHFILPMVLILVIAVPVMAAEKEGITKEDALKGLVIILGVIIVAKVAKILLNKETKNEPTMDKKPVAGYTDNDIELLARLIYAESRGEPYEGQVAVGAVVLNRVKSPLFPNTIRGVIYQSNQFACVTNGQINLTPNETALKAAKEAMLGSDPSLGALYFYNPKKTNNMEWWSTRKTTVNIGNHAFAK